MPFSTGRACVGASMPPLQHQGRGVLAPTFPLAVGCVDGEGAPRMDAWMERVPLLLLCWDLVCPDEQSVLRPSQPCSKLPTRDTGLILKGLALDMGAQCTSCHLAIPTLPQQEEKGLWGA